MANVKVTAIASTPSATKKIISRLSVAASRSGRSGSSIWTAPCTASIAPRFLREMCSRMGSQILKYFRYVGVSAESLLGSRLCGGSRILRARTRAMAAILVCSPRTNRAMARGHCEPVISPSSSVCALSSIPGGTRARSLAMRTLRLLRGNGRRSSPLSSRRSNACRMASRTASWRWGRRSHRCEQ
jgi:hypothetical protein